ncbi:MAG: class I SAM-dependent DNA methyltransferase [Eubacteriales bacterium]
MSAYFNFAKVYDLFMEDVPYDKWVNYIIDIFNYYSVPPGLVLDLGCGTGNITQRLSQKGYDMIGVDNSEEMLMVAQEKAKGECLDILYLHQDMREFELYGTVKAIISTCDSINYIIEEDDLLNVFKLVNNYLDPGGLFVFDLNTKYKYKHVLGDRIFAENKEESSYIWQNCYYEKDGINEYNLTLFFEVSQGLFNRFEETHYQRAYSFDDIKMLLEDAGLEFLSIYDALTFELPKEDSERVYIIAKEKKQSKKYVNFCINNY